MQTAKQAIQEKEKQIELLQQETIDSNKKLEKQITESLKQIETLKLSESTALKQVEEVSKQMKTLNKPEEIEVDQLEINKMEVLGKGSFGKVYSGTYFKAPVAIKMFKDVTLNKVFWDDFDNEISILMYADILLL